MGYGKPAQFNTGDAQSFKKAIDMTDDELAAISSGARLDFLHQKNLCDWLRLGFSFEPWQRRIAGR
jgi:hypothetical protein